MTDGSSIFMIFMEFWRHELSAGRLPLWNPFIFGGFPFFAEPQTAIFYPLKALFLLPGGLDFPFKLFLHLHLWIAGWGMYRLCRISGAGREGAALAGLAFALNTQFILFMFGGWLPHLSTAAWAPAVVWLYMKACILFPQKKYLKYAGLAGGAGALQFLAGHPEWLYYTWLLLGALAIYFTAQRFRAHRAYSPWLCLGILILLTVLLSGIQLIPTVEAMIHSGRGQGALGGSTAVPGSGFPPAFLPALLIPRLFGPWDLSVSVNSWLHKMLNAQVAMGECIFYGGILSIMALFAAFRRGHKPVSPFFWLSVLIMSLLIAMNDVTGLKDLIDRLLPAQAVFRSPARFVFLSSLSLCVLAGLGFTRVLENDWKMPRVVLVISILAAVAAIAGGACGVFSPGAIFRKWGMPLLERISDPAMRETWKSFGLDAVKNTGMQILISGALLAASLAVLKRKKSFGVLAMVLTFDLLAAGWPFLTQYLDPARLTADTPRLAIFKDASPQGRVHFSVNEPILFSTNVVSPLGIRSSYGYESFTLNVYEEWIKHYRPQKDIFLAGFNVRYWVSLAAPGNYDKDAPWNIKQLPDALPRFYLASKTVLEPSWKEGFKHYPELLAAKGGLAVLHPRKSGIEAENFSWETKPDVNLVSDMPNRIDLETRSTHDAWLVANEVDYPGWRARVDGEEKPLVRANGFMRAVRVPSGNHRVSLVYVPESLYQGVVLTAVGLFVFLFLITRKKPPHAR